jgi:hypothetical protein
LGEAVRPLLPLLAIALLVGACGANDEQVHPTPTTVDRTDAEWRAEVARLEAELVKQAVDQQDLREQVKRLYVERASRSTRTARRVVAARPAGDCWGWGHLVFAYDWPHSTACAVLGCESGGNPNAKNRRSSATGLFQILNGPYDPAANVALAYRMWRARGWQPWNVGGCP